MVPELTTCDECGRTVIVLCWGHHADDPPQLDTAVDSHDLRISCTIDCPGCGTRIQFVDALPQDYSG